jgi:hypothetical protein
LLKLINAYFGEWQVSMTIDSSGNVGIGTNNPNNALHISSNSFTQLTLQSGSSGNTYSSYYWKFGHNSADGALYLESAFSSVANMYVARNSPGWQNYSDRRLKENIIALDNYDMLTKIRQIKPVSFNIRCPNNNATQIGVIAQDVQEVFPSLVTESSATILGVEKPLGISLTGFIIPLLAAFQELDKDYQEMKQNYIILQTQINQLIQRLAVANIA